MNSKVRVLPCGGCANPNCNGLFITKEGMERHCAAATSKSLNRLAMLYQRDMKNGRYPQSASIFCQDLQTSNMDEYNEDVEMLAAYLRNNWRTSVKEVFKSGSLGKGTSVQDQADIDLVVFLNNFNGFRNYSQNVRRNLDALESDLKVWAMNNTGGRMQVVNRTIHAIQVLVKKRKDNGFIKADVLPAADLLKEEGPVAIYRQMGSMDREERECMSSALSPRQKEFVSEKLQANPRLREVIRAIKFWKTQLFKAAHKKAPGSYFFELLTIGVCEENGRNNYSDEELVKKVLRKIQNYPEIYYEWSGSYTGYGIHTSHDRPLILDPANPFNNICDRVKEETWELLRRAARGMIVAIDLQEEIAQKGLQGMNVKKMLKKLAS